MVADMLGLRLRKFLSARRELAFEVLDGLKQTLLEFYARLPGEFFARQPDIGPVSYTHLTLPTIYSV